MSAGGRRLRTKVERVLAFQLMAFGDWRGSEVSHVANGKLLRHDFEFRPYDPEDAEAQQGFSIVTSLSSLHAARYSTTTLRADGSFEAIRVEPEPGALSEVVPADYWEKQFRSLRLWVFDVTPSAAVRTVAQS